MIPAPIESHLRQHHAGYEHHLHASAATGQELAAAEHITGHKVAKPVVLKLDGELAIAVVSAADRVNLEALRRATGRVPELVAEAEFAWRFSPCAAGAEPALAMWGLPIYVDDRLAREVRIVMQAGTHEDAIVLDTREWMDCERVTPIEGLGGPVH